MRQVASVMAGGRRVNDLCYEGHVLSANSGGGSGHDFYESSVCGPRVEPGVIPAHGLTAGHPRRYSEGERDSPTGRVNSSCKTGYSNIGHNRMVGNSLLAGKVVRHMAVGRK